MGLDIKAACSADREAVTLAPSNRAHASDWLEAGRGPWSSSSKSVPDRQSPSVEWTIETWNRHRPSSAEDLCRITTITDVIMARVRSHRVVLASLDVVPLPLGFSLQIRMIRDTGLRRTRDNDRRTPVEPTDASRSTSAPSLRIRLGLRRTIPSRVDLPHPIASALLQPDKALRHLDDFRDNIHGAALSAAAPELLDHDVHIGRLSDLTVRLPAPGSFSRNDGFLPAEDP